MSLAPSQFTAGFSAAAGLAVLPAIPPLTIKDHVTGLHLYVCTVAGAAALDSVTLAIYATPQRPASAANAASSGRVLLATITIPLLPLIIDPLIAATNACYVALHVPLLLSPDQQTRFLNVVVTAGDRDITGVVSLDVERRES